MKSPREQENIVVVNIKLLQKQIIDFYRKYRAFEIALLAIGTLHSFPEVSLEVLQYFRIFL